MPMVLNRVVGPSGEQPSDHCPFVPIKSVRCKQLLLLLVGERLLVDSRIQLIEPPQSATFSCTEGKGKQGMR